MTNQERDKKDVSPSAERAGSHSKEGRKDGEDMTFDTTAANDVPAAVLDERIQAQIGQQLTSFYRELVKQPIPQNFIDLLAQLDRQEDGK